ncbi:TetR/AcrR family transcriptional regulator [Dasania sp. GY-MA-18]|uniref:TetR/AcrR family transcriptional regulator n=2 Tax=Dasania phycosphaerae TaxID=2950436 RepID=A0A9J6RM32_9GAMM|nr:MULTISPECIES: TetR/AcrR family transcriptional regulator [Dasania]MCR8923003.1 TetR/AcrR family transcriptional regulator [Dasania sp. GY-MA-18]MCZ0865434.1 TetR/AcrR family transcriptional regulator [Dasania phycosphaerae]MCZ0869159.1 TetR/AcrR family transcriptional regulator [Dasania phycosphaerae]
MPYSPQHKQQSRQKILASAYRLFTLNGYERITINQIMADCQLTRGGFYAHFSSKSELYTEALKFGTTASPLVLGNLKSLSTQHWLTELFDGYLSIEHIRGIKPCPLAFLSADITTRDRAAKAAYKNAFLGMNKRLLALVKQVMPFTTEQMFALSSMMIGTVAIAKTINDDKVALQLLRATRKTIRLTLNGI